MLASPIHVPSLTPESVLGGGVLCPGCGVPFHTQRSPQLPNEGAVATGLFIDFEGQLVLCDSCVAQLATEIGWINPEAGKARVSDVRRSQKRDEAVKSAADARDTARQAADAFSAALDNLDEVLG